MQLRKTISVLTAALTLLAGGAIVSGSAYADDNTPAVVSAKAAGEVLAQYNFDDGSLNDSSGNNAVALQTFSGAKIENYNDINSKALSVRGAKQYAESIGSPFASVTDGISFSFRAKTRNVSAGDVGVIVGTDSNKYGSSGVCVGVEHWSGLLVIGVRGVGGRVLRI